VSSIRSTCCLLLRRKSMQHPARYACCTTVKPFNTQDEIKIRTWREAPSDSFYSSDILRNLTLNSGDEVMHAVALQCYQFRHDDRRRGAA
jgi:hypothetical protein